MALSVASMATAAQAGPDVCPPEEGELTIDQLPAGMHVQACGLTGRVVTHDGTGVTIPELETAVSIHSISADGTSHGFTVTVAADGLLSYDLSEDNFDSPSAGSDRADVVRPSTTTADLTDESDGTDPDPVDPEGVAVADADAAASPGACSDGAYATADQKEYGTYNWYIGDGDMPGGLDRNRALLYFADSIYRIESSHNNCGLADQVGASAHYAGTTAYEADVSDHGTCTARDGKSTWDAGNLAGAIASTCSWTWPTPGVKNDLREADVRFNIHDHDFTTQPTTSCSGKYDILSVGTHEAGHVFGLQHVGTGHANLTMYPSADPCVTKMRTLGKGDVNGLRSIY